MTLTVTPELNLKQNIVGWGNVDTAAFEKPRLCSQNSIKANLPTEVRKETVSEEVILAKIIFLLKRTFEVLQDLESSKNKILEADSNL